jgi:hypothetical protein
MNAFFAKVVAALGAIGAQLPSLALGTGADFEAAEQAVLKVVTDLQADLTTLINAVKSST